MAVGNFLFSKLIYFQKLNKQLNKIVLHFAFKFKLFIIQKTSTIDDFNSKVIKNFKFTFIKIFDSNIIKS